MEIYGHNFVWNTMGLMYVKYKKSLFPKLFHKITLGRQNVEEANKSKIASAAWRTC